MSKRAWDWEIEDFLRAAKKADAGVVDQQVDPSGLREHLGHERRDRFVVGHVTNQHPDAVGPSWAALRLVPNTVNLEGYVRSPARGSRVMEGDLT